MAKFVAKGTQLQVGDGEEPEVFTTIPQVGDIDGPGGDSEEIDVTDHDSPGNTDETLPGTVNPGDLSFPIHYDPDLVLHNQLFNDQKGQTVRNYRIVYTTAGDKTFGFPAFVKQFRQAAPVKGALRWNLTLRVAGDVVEVAA